MNDRNRTTAMTAADYSAIREIVARHAGITLSEDAREAAARKLSERLSALGLRSFSQYAEHLRSQDRGWTELERLVELVATHETYFFRELPQLRAFADELLPRLREQLGVRRTLTIWSAGCSTGEEAYSLAMLIDDRNALGDIGVRIIGTDISRRVVHAARRGSYRSGSFRAMPPHYEGYFEATKDGRVVVPGIRAMCQFAQLNLLDDAKAVLVGRVDAIFCRNVLIYFDADARRRLIDVLYDRLHPGGYLMLGHSESLLGQQTSFEPVSLENSLVYRRPSLRPGAARSEVEP